MPKAKKKLAKKPVPVVKAPALDPPPDFGVPMIQQHPEWPLITRRQYCARWKIGTVSQYEHRRELIKSMWTPDVYELNPWSEIRLKSTCQNVFTLWMSGGGTGKTYDAAAQAVEYWLEAPWETAVIVCSTTMSSLRRRIWCEICTLWNAMRPEFGYGNERYKGVLTDANCMIRWQDGDMKNGIFGVAVREGPPEQAINQLRGIHTRRVWWILDEMQGVEEAIMGVLANHAKNPEAKFTGFGNPTDPMNMFARYMEPLDGWSSVVRGETPDWPINQQVYLGTGRAFFFDGRKSPACLDPEWGRRNPWMINKAQIDRHIELKGMDDAEVWCDSIGWFPVIGKKVTLLDTQLIEKFRCHDPAHWTNGFRAGWSLDPAFSEGGDKRILQFFKFGEVDDPLGKRWVIEFGEWCEVPLTSSAGAEPRNYQIMEFVKGKCESKGLKAHDGATDSSGTGLGLHDIFLKEWGPVVGVEFGGAPSDRPVDAAGKKAKDAFDRRSSELNVMINKFATSNGIRGLSKEAADEAMKRLMIYEGKGKWTVESKKIMKARGEHSPDHCDAVAIAVEFARQNGAVPADFKIASEPEKNAERARAEEHYFSEDRLADQDEWQQDYAMML